MQFQTTMIPIKTANRYIILDMTQNTKNTASNHASNGGSLVCCRACLGTEGRMYHISERGLIDAFSSLVGIRIIKDKLPQYLCACCRTLVLKFAPFKDQCLRIHKSLLHELCKGALNADNIRKTCKPSNQLFNLTLTDVEIVDCVPSENVTDAESPDDMSMGTVEYIDDDVFLMEDINNTDSIEINTTDEQNIDGFHVNSTSPRTDDRMDFGDTLDEIIASNKKAFDKVLDNNKIQSNTKKKKEKVGAKLKIEKCEDDDVVTGSSENESNMATYIEDDGIVLSYNLDLLNKENEDNSAIKNTKSGKCNDLDKLAFADVLLEVEDELREIARNKVFERHNKVRIVILSKEEQLAEFLARQETTNYQESEYRCEQCFRGFHLEATYENHMLTHSPSWGAFSCEICHTRFAKRRHWARHMNTHQIKIYCELCDTVTRSRDKAMQHYARHAGKTFECPHCGKSFKTQVTMLSHSRLAHPAQNVACELCGEAFVGEHGLKLHKARVHTEKIKCTVCSAKFVNLSALNRHMDTAGEHTYPPCEQCGENCASEKALREHVAIMHPTKSHRCERCHILFPSAQAYKTHVLKKHLQGNANKAGPLGARMRAERLGPGSKMCDQCGKIMPNAARLRLHQRTHEGIKPFACDYCSKTFAGKHTLIFHLRSHTGEKPYKCPECPLAFSSKSNFNRHHRNVHLGLRDSFPCPICGSAATTKASLRVHVDAKHGGKGWPRRRKRERYITKP